MLSVLLFYHLTFADLYYLHCTLLSLARRAPLTPGLTTRWGLTIDLILKLGATWDHIRSQWIMCGNDPGECELPHCKCFKSFSSCMKLWWIAFSFKLAFIAYFNVIDYNLIRELAGFW